MEEITQAQLVSQGDRQRYRQDEERRLHDSDAIKDLIAAQVAGIKRSFDEEFGQYRLTAQAEVTRLGEENSMLSKRLKESLEDKLSNGTCNSPLISNQQAVENALAIYERGVKNGAASVAASSTTASTSTSSTKSQGDQRQELLLIPSRNVTIIYNNNATALALQVNRAIFFVDPDTGPIVTWPFMQIQMPKMLECCRLLKSPRTFAEGEGLFDLIVGEFLTMAGSYEEEANIDSTAKLLRAEQQRAFNSEMLKCKKHMRTHSKMVGLETKLFETLFHTLATSVFGLSVDPDYLTNIRKGQVALNSVTKLFGATRVNTSEEEEDSDEGYNKGRGRRRKRQRGRGRGRAQDADEGYGYNEDRGGGGGGGRGGRGGRGGKGGGGGGGGGYSGGGGAGGGYRESEQRVTFEANKGETSGNERKKDGYVVGGATGGGGGGGGGAGGGPRKQRKEVPNAAEILGKIEGTLPKAKGTCHECPSNAEFNCHEYFECPNVYKRLFGQDLPGWKGDDSLGAEKNLKGELRFANGAEKDKRHWTSDLSHLNPTGKALWRELQAQGFFGYSAFKDKTRAHASFEP